MIIYRLSIEAFINEEYYERYGERFPTYKKAVAHMETMLKEEGAKKRKDKIISEESIEVSYEFNDVRGFTSKHRYRIYPFEVKDHKEIPEVLEELPVKPIEKPVAAKAEKPEPKSKKNNGK